MATRLFVRREIWGLERTKTWDPHTLAYAKAIKEMQGRPFPADQTNYSYQAFMHGNDDDPGKGPDGVWNGCPDCLGEALLVYRRRG
jgi:hypothetical protein